MREEEEVKEEKEMVNGVEGGKLGDEKTEEPAPKPTENGTTVAEKAIEPPAVTEKAKEPPAEAMEVEEQPVLHSYS